MKKNIPFIVVHKGRQDYLKSCLSSIQQFNKVYLLGDEENKNLTSNWINMNSLSNNYTNMFDKVYLHLSSNSELFEKICFYRYIAMYEFAKKNNIDEFIHCDSDMLMLHECTMLFDDFENYGAAYFIPHEQSNNRMTASPHLCYWKLDVLEEFIRFFIEQYQIKSRVLIEKYNYHIQNKIPGGICDMTLLYMFAHNRKDILNLFNIDNYYLNFNVSTNESMNCGREYIIFDHKYKVINKKLFYKYNDNIVPVAFLHMQGSAKRFMKYAKAKQYRRLFFCVSILNIIRLIKIKR